MDKYYFKTNEKPQGPFDFITIIDHLLRGSIDTSTHISVEGESWRPLLEYQEFHFLFPQDQDIAWTLLKKYEDQFIQTQSYSQKGLQWLLDSKLISDQDFIWKEGDESWNRISLSPEFETSLDASLEDFMDKASVNTPESSEVFIYQRPAPKFFDGKN